MRLRDAASEAFRNLQSGTARAGLIALLLITIAVLLLFADVAAVASLEQRAEAIRDRGGDVRVLVAEDSVEPRACAALAELATIDEAGAIWQLDSTNILALPRVEVPVYQVSFGAARILGISSKLPGEVHLPSLLAERWSAHPGSTIPTSNGDLVVAGTFDYSEGDGRDPRFTNAILVTGENSQLSSECWFRSWPSSEEVLPLSFGAAVVSSSGNAIPEVAPLNPTIGAGPDFSSEFSERPTALASTVAVAAFALAGLIGMLRRRLEAASNLHAGARRRDLVKIAAIETFTWAGLVAIFVFIVARVGIRVAIESVSIRASLETYYGLAVSIGVGVAVAASLVPIILASESRLFTLFKNR